MNLPLTIPISPTFAQQKVSMIVKHLVMKKLIFCLFIGSSLLSCRYDDFAIDPKEDYLVFGTFYGMCAGNCVNFYLINKGELYQINNHEYPNQQHRFDFSSVTKLSDEKFKSVENLWTQFPPQLKSESQTVFGCPDCADGGGTYLEIAIDGEIKYWYIDNSEANVPAYLNNYAKMVRESMKSLIQ
jgi:hypothetical protein